MALQQPIDQILEFRVNGDARKALVRTPARLCTHPALLVVLNRDKEAMLSTSDGVGITPAIFLAAGHRIASFDLPNHGERTDRHGPELQGMAAAIAAGVDVFDDIHLTTRALIDQCLERGLAGAGGIVIEGTSRGGLGALHVMAGESRVGAGAVHASVTHLPTLREFAHLEGNPIIARSNADALIDRLVDRPLFFTMGESDPRVSAQHCFDLCARLSARATTNPPELFTAPGVSHGESFPFETGYQVAAAFLLRHLATRAKLLPFRYGA